MNDDRWMKMAYDAAIRSKDPRTKIGCVLVDKWSETKYLLAANRPAGKATPEQFENTPLTKHDYMEHAERIAIMNAFKLLELEDDLTDFVIYVNETPCTDCMNAIVESGIRDVRTCERWYQHCLTHGPDPEEKYKKAATIMAANGGLMTRSAWNLGTVHARRDDLQFQPMDW